MTEENVEQALAGGAPQRVGWFRFYFDDGRWEWSEQVQRMHGYEPGTVTPTTDLVLSHKHPEDRGQVAATIEDIRRTHQPFSTRHRIIDAQGHVHHVVVVGDQLYDENGAVDGTHGFYVDVTPVEQAREQVLSAAVAEISQNRAVIEQVKGMLMLIYGIDEDAAFDLLKWRSQEANVKLRLLAAQIAADFLAVGCGDTPAPRATYDQLLLTAHTRVAKPANS
jgi:PAS domain S-box-containing protein